MAVATGKVTVRREGVWVDELNTELPWRNQLQGPNFRTVPQGFYLHIAVHLRYSPVDRKSTYSSPLRTAELYPMYCSPINSAMITFVDQNIEKLVPDVGFIVGRDLSDHFTDKKHIAPPPLETFPMFSAPNTARCSSPKTIDVVWKPEHG